MTLTADSPRPIFRETARRGTEGSVELKIPVDRLETALNWVMSQPGIAPELSNAIVGTLWLMQVDAFRQQEEEGMLSNKYDAMLNDHRPFLADLIANGETLIWAAKKSGMVSPPLKFTIEDLEATLNSLHATFRAEHGPKNSQKTNELIAQLFDGQKP